MKIKKITLEGFRGILKSQSLSLCVKGDSTPRSLALFGPNSSGKTSFVDGIEWFLSPDNKIEWLKRQDAEEKAYPHQALDTDKDVCSVELELFDSESNLGTLRKTYNFRRITRPELNSDSDFSHLQGKYIIKPYLRYLEVIDFVYNRTGLEKYQKLSEWMGFEQELAFQEKIALKIIPEIKKKKDELSSKVKVIEQQLKALLNNQSPEEGNLLSVANTILGEHKQPRQPNIKSLFKYIPEFAKQRISTSAGKTVDILTQAETSIVAFKPNTKLAELLRTTRSNIEQFRKEQAIVEQLDIISLYDKALELLNKQDSESTKCPVCGTVWERSKLIGHINEELQLLHKVKADKEEIQTTIENIKEVLRIEQQALSRLVNSYESVRNVIGEIDCTECEAYKLALSDTEKGWLSKPFTGDLTDTITVDIQKSVVTERDKLSKLISSKKQKIQPSKEDIKLSEDIERLNQMQTKWNEILEAKQELLFFSEQMESLITICNELIANIQDSVKSRFNEISDRIAQYFGILRSDKDIKDIQIVLNVEKGKAAGRSAEIQLLYYDVSVKPAYKVLSESLLNSLGLAVYFACIKQFNSECKFIILDDIMNSLDIDKRDTLLDLIQQEFSDYQVVIFTHDLYWFQKIVRRFPNWIPKKIKGWSYIGGARIDFAKTTKQQIDEFLSDSTTVENAGWMLARHIENTLNELCDRLWAKVTYRYTRNDPPSMEELFDALVKRLKKRLKNHPAVLQLVKAKKFEPILRNFVTHARSNAASSVSPQEIQRAAKEWFSFEDLLWCSNCNRFTEYHRQKDSIECRCGQLSCNASGTIGDGKVAQPKRPNNS
ncbi:MAG: AAA family ATPase [Candidatus Hodarchaeales archaeon]